MIRNILSNKFNNKVFLKLLTSKFFFKFFIYPDIKNKDDLIFSDFLIHARDFLGLKTNNNYQSEFILEKLKDLFSDVSESGLNHNLPELVVLEGSLAYELFTYLHVNFFGKKLPLNSSNLLRLLFITFFNSDNKRSVFFYKRLRNNLSSDIDLKIYFKDPSLIDKEEFFKKINELFSSRTLISPQINCRYRKISSISYEDSCRGLVIHSSKYAKKFISTKFNSKNNYYGIYKNIFYNLLKIKHLDDIYYKSWINKISNDFNNYNNKFILPPDYFYPEIKRSKWLDMNQEFFDTLEDPNVIIYAEDATYDLNDLKGLEKKLEKTILNIQGLELNGSFIDAYDLVLKFRGLTENKFGNENFIDMLKEYLTHSYLSSKKQISSFKPMIGPICFNINRIYLKNINVLKEPHIGFFMQRIPKNEYLNITFRVNNLGTITKFFKLFSEILKKIRDSQVNINNFSLFYKVFSLNFYLLAFKAELTVCDMLIKYHSVNGKVISISIFDFERHSFAKLVNEDHPILKNFFDLKSSLPKRGEFRKNELNRLFTNKNFSKNYPL